MMFRKTILYFYLLAGGVPLGTAGATAVRPAQVVEAARFFLDHYEISYAYGGGKVGDEDQCKKCNDCLAGKGAAPKRQLQECPACQTCSIDCSHFVELVFRRVGLPFSYLTSVDMVRLTTEELLQKYYLRDVGIDLRRAQPGDLVVYDNHVVMVEKIRGPGQGDVIHATGGRELKGPGLGIQRERFVFFDGFRGVARRLLRHKDVKPLESPTK